jgi:hypothetical protein
MAQRSLHAVIKVYYSSMSCFNTFSRTNDTACSAKVSHTNVHSCTIWVRRFTNYVTKYDHKVWSPERRVREMTEREHRAHFEELTLLQT